MAEQNVYGEIDVAYVAGLARLRLTPEEERMFQAQLECVVDYVKKVSELDVSGIEPTSHAVSVTNVFRADEVRRGLDVGHTSRNAPSWRNGHFCVPRIVE